LTGKYKIKPPPLNFEILLILFSFLNQQTTKKRII